MNLRELAERIRRSGFRVQSVWRQTEVRGDHNQFHHQTFGQDYKDDSGRLVHAEWDGDLWQLFDANTGELFGLHHDRQLPDPNTFRPPGGPPADVAHNDQLLSELRQLLSETE